MIHETIITTAARDGTPHIAPMGVRFEQGLAILAPFRPSTTLDNILATQAAVINFTTDVRVFAGCVTGTQRDWPTVAATRVPSVRLAQPLAHTELALAETLEDAQRPTLKMRCVHSETHAPFGGFNRAQAAVIEGAILVSRLFMLPADKVDREVAYLRIAIDKTAGPDELTAWSWILAAIDRYRATAAQQPGSSGHASGSSSDAPHAMHETP
ncbi:DUF447 domain-containing protein [Paraburkholderia solisilvae]|uniref:Tetrahydromethanopterin synthesis protein n=1 Tax=Paraburkholderia solisilvae TaxID=624376 RepID=A0A6J5DKD5_9BURK|nr:DUF447 domain-containing protein [Paraburkholderia solisilvae]CAB3753907.1 hypothetical protein LMG29739_01825 [Paraburkholderia solisilvae]